MSITIIQQPDLHLQQHHILSDTHMHKVNKDDWTKSSKDNKYNINIDLIFHNPF